MTKDVYRYLFKTYGRSAGVWLGFVFLLLGDFFTVLVLPFVSAEFVGQLSEGLVDDAKTSAVYFLIATLIGGMLVSVGRLFSSWYDSAVYAKESARFYESLIGQDIHFFARQKTGSLVASHRQFVDGSISILKLYRQRILFMPISLLGPIILLGMQLPVLGLITFIFVVVQIAYVVWVSKKVGVYRKEANRLYREATAEISDDITNIMAFKAAGRSNQQTKKVYGLTWKEHLAFWGRQRVTIAGDYARFIISSSFIAFALWVLADQTSSVTGEEVALAVLTVTYLLGINRAVRFLPQTLLEHDDHIAKAGPHLELLNRQNRVEDVQGAQDMKVKKGLIEIKDVSFTYDDSNKRQVFKSLNITIEPGEKVGVVGLSGAGKSTLAALLLRFSDVDSGQVLIDGQDVTQVTQESLRRQIAYVPQEPLLFHKTIKENIKYFRPGATNKEVEAAAKAAHAKEFIDDLPDGYSSVVGERGMQLSGGQKQRVVIARSILKNAPIMILDEATSALDSESEEIIQRAMPDILGNHTALVIAHRLGTVAGLDRIIVLDKGKIIEEGSHRQLLRKKGVYAGLWKKQSGRN